ncbi:hypothetical protein Ccrd_010205, partial [Cynara cardunculus var. scolymus]
MVDNGGFWSRLLLCDCYGSILLLISSLQTFPKAFTDSSPSSPSSTFSPSFPSSTFTIAVATFFTWLANFKLLFTFNHGPLYPPKSLIQFIVVTFLPVKIKPQFFNPKNKSSVYLWIESMLFPLLINFAYNYKHELNPHVLLIVYCFIMFILIDLLVFVSNAVIGAVAGVELEPLLDLPSPLDEPYLLTSLQDFWGRRWNLMPAHTVYKPVKYVLPAKEWATAMAVMATFIVSGLMHELMFYYVIPVSPTWEMSFFVFHGIRLIMELK